MIEIKSLTKRFYGLIAIDNVSTSIETGKITAIIGPNGAGKSTFFNLIAGTHAPSSGEVIFDGRNIAGLKPCLLYTSPSPRDRTRSRMPSSA